MIGKRALLLTAAGVAARRAFAALPVPAGDTLAFRLIRHGDAIGSHTLTFARHADTLSVHVAVDATVTLLSLPIVRYRHRVEETWQAGKLVGLAAETDKNGQHEWVKAQRGPAGLEVSGSKTETYLAPEPAGATSYWNKQLLGRPMISLEDGVLLRPKVAVEPPEAIPLASGGSVPAEHYNLSGPFNVDLWYDRSDTWAGMAVTVADGSIVHYERL